MRKLLWPSPQSIPDISDHQRSALAAAFRGPVGLLTGVPGTGKTRTAAAAIKAIIREHGESSVAVAAPTGKAAVRCSAAMKAYGVEIPATTIHRLLGVRRGGHDGKGWGFQHDESNPLRYRFVVVDELSMLDVDLASSLFRAMEQGTHFLGIGDPYQLAPVGHGAPLRDFLGSGLPHGSLSEIWRQGKERNDIVDACCAIKDGKSYSPSPRVDLSTGNNLLHIETHRPAISLASLKRFICGAPTGIDPIWDIQVLCAVNAKSELCRKRLNEELQSLLNPNGKRVDGIPFRVGDKVICTSNTMLPLVPEQEQEDYDPFRDIGTTIVNERARPRPVPENSEDTREFVANGEVGRVLTVEPKLMMVRFDAPARTVKVPMGAKKKAGGSGSKSEAEQDEDSESTGGGCDFDLGFAITIHRFQGSQQKVVVVIIDDFPGARMIGSRELWYTALSRAELLCATIGRKSTLDLDCKRVSLKHRKTFLRELLEQETAA